MPICNAFLICEKIIFDTIATAPTLIGLFSEFGIVSLPSYLSPFWLFIQAADGVIGEYKVEIEIQDLDRGETVHRFKAKPLIFDTRPEVYNSMIAVPPMRIDYPSGVYAVVVFADGKMFAQQKFTVRIAENPS